MVFFRYSLLIIRKHNAADFFLCRNENIGPRGHFVPKWCIFFGTSNGIVLGGERGLGGPGKFFHSLMPSRDGPALTGERENPYKTASEKSDPPSLQTRPPLRLSWRHEYASKLVDQAGSNTGASSSSVEGVRQQQQQAQQERELLELERKHLGGRRWEVTSEECRLALQQRKLYHVAREQRSVENAIAIFRKQNLAQARALSFNIGTLNPKKTKILKKTEP